MQRLKTVASRGAEIGLKAGSQPAGIFVGGCARAGDWVDADGNNSNSRCQTIGLKTGSRSPLRARLTDVCGPADGKPAPVVGSDGIDTSAAVNSASETAPIAPARGTEKISNIGLSPKLRHQIPHQPERPRDLISVSR